MDLGFTGDQETLKESARSFVDREASSALARSPVGQEVDSVWRSMVQLGWPAVAIPTDLGGAGMGLIELAILLEQVGRGILPGPLFATAGLYAPALLACTASDHRDACLRGIATGATGTLALSDADGAWAWESPTTVARRTASGFTLTGVKHFVVEGGHADEILVTARDSDSGGLGLFAVPGSAVDAEPLNALDPSLRLATVRLNDVEIPTNRAMAEAGQAEAALTRSLQSSLVATAILNVGTCQDILDRTLEYAKTRKQFDQAIGSFQAIKHKLADMFVAVERARSLAYFAALTICEDDPRRDVAASMAKAAAGDCQRLLVQDGLQLHGGIGYTWEYDLHLYLKRAASLDALLGSSRLHRRRIADRLGLKSASAG